MRAHWVRAVGCCLMFIFLGSAMAEPASGDEPDSALHGYLGANGMLNRGLYELATTEYRKFLAEYGTHEKARAARYGLSVSLFRLKRFEEAVEELAVLERHSGFAFAAEVGTMLGQSQLALKNYAEAAGSFKKVLRRHAEHALADDAAAGRVESLYLVGEYQKSAKAGDDLVKRWPESPLRERAEFFAALAMMARQRYGEAAKRFDELLQRFESGPLAPQASLLLAQCYQNDNALDRAVRQYRRVVKSAAKRHLPHALFGLATLLQQLGEPAEAGTLLDRLIERDPTGPLVASAQLLRGRVWFDQDRFDRALDVFQPLIDGEASLADQAAYWGAKCRLRQGEFEDTADRLTASIEKFSTSKLLPEMYYDRAIAFVRLGARDDAVSALGSFRERFPDHSLAPEALRLLAVTEHQRKRYDESQGYAKAWLSDHANEKAAPAVAFLSAENEFLAERYEPAVAAYQRFLNTHGRDAQASRAAFRLGTALLRLQRFDEAEPFLSQVADGSGTEETYRPALLALGDIAFQRGEWKRAEAHLKDYLAAGPGVASADDALLKLGLSQHRQENHADALKSYDRLIERFDDSPHRLQAMFERGQALVALHRPDDARAAFESVVSEGGDSRFAPHALNHLASIAMKQKDFDATAKLFERAAKAATGSKMKSVAAYQQAQSLMAAQQFGDAEKAFDSFLEQYPRHERAPQAHAHRAIALARQNKHEEAIQAIEKLERRLAGSLDPSLFGALRYEKAWCLRELGRADEAAIAYEALLAEGLSGGFSVHAAMELSGIHVNQKRFAEAAALLEPLYESLQGDSSAMTTEVREQLMYRLAVCWFELGRFRESAALFTQFTEAFPESKLVASAYFYGGEASFRLGKFQRAVKHLTRVTENHTDDNVYGPSLLRLGESLASLQRWAKSERIFTDYLQRFADSPQWFQAQFGVGFARENQKRHAEAISAYGDVVARHQGPTSARAQFQIGECLFAQKNYDEAVRELLKVDILYAYPEWSAAALFEAGRCFEKLGKTVEARRQFKQVAKAHDGTRWATMASQRLSELSSATVPGR